MRSTLNTNKGIQLPDIANQCSEAIKNAQVVQDYTTKLPKAVWSCQKGYWVIVNA
jgi:hypothetical protein